MKLTEDQIKDLESRGIKPGVKLICAWDKSLIFTFSHWGDMEQEDNGNISSRYRKYGDNNSHVWLYVIKANIYATPIE